MQCCHFSEPFENHLAPRGFMGIEMRSEDSSITVNSYLLTFRPKNKTISIYLWDVIEESFSEKL